MSLRERLQSDLRLALRDGDRLRMSVLRTTLAAVDNAEAVDPVSVTPGATEVARVELSEADVRAIVRRERDDLVAAAEELRTLPGTAAANSVVELEAQAAVLADYVVAEPD